MNAQGAAIPIQPAASGRPPGPPARGLSGNLKEWVDDPRFNEGDVASRTAAYFGSQHFDWRLDAPTGASLLEHFLSTLDQPTIDGFNTFCVSKHAHDHGIKAVLSGSGGDATSGRRCPVCRAVERALPSAAVALGTAAAA